MKSKRSVTVVFEDAVVRQRAVDFCDQLVKRLWTQAGFEVNWWPFEALRETSILNESLEKAGPAHVVVFAAQPEGDFPAEVKDWIETWLRQRGEKEGVIVGLIGREPGPASAASYKHIYLHNIACRAGMDFLTEMPRDLTLIVPDSIEAYSERASQVTGVLEGILRHNPPPGLVL